MLFLMILGKGTVRPLNHEIEYEEKGTPMRPILISFLCAFVWCSLGLAESIALKSGGVMEGDISELNEAAMIEVRFDGQKLVEAERPTNAKAVDELAHVGLRLYNEGDFAGSSRGGHDVDLFPQSRGFEFWSDGVWAELDGNSKGNSKIIYRIENERLRYVGSVAEDGIYSSVGKGFETYLGQKYEAPFEQ